jgi:hypothetical protein
MAFELPKGYFEIAISILFSVLPSVVFVTTLDNVLGLIPKYAELAATILAGLIGLNFYQRTKYKTLSERVHYLILLCSPGTIYVLR